MQTQTYILDSYAGKTLRRHRFDNVQEALNAVALLREYWPDATGELTRLTVYDGELAVPSQLVKF